MMIASSEKEREYSTPRGSVEMLIRLAAGQICLSHSEQLFGV